MAESKSKSTNNGKTFLFGAGGALVAIGLVLGSVSAASALGGSARHNAEGRMEGRMEGGGAKAGMHGGGGVGGEVTKVDGNTITLKGRNDATVTVQVDDKTDVKKSGDDASIGDLTVGSQVMVRGEINSISVEADVIGIRE